MHLIPAIPGGWNPDDEGVIHVEQKPGDILFLAHADTEISTLNSAWHELSDESGGSDLPSLRMAGLGYFKQELTIDTYIEEVVQHAKLIVLRLLGGRSYHQYLCESLERIAAEKGITLIFLPGDDKPDSELFELSNADIAVCNTVWKYFIAGGKANLRENLKYLLNTFFQFDFSVQPVKEIPESFLYDPQDGIISREQQHRLMDPNRPTAAILTYRTHYLAGNLAPVHELAARLRAKGMNVVVGMALSLRDEGKTDDLLDLLTDGGQHSIDVVINTTSFAIKPVAEEAYTNGQSDGKERFLFSKIGAPVIQVIQATCNRQTWLDGSFGLPPTDITMNIALPEVDGKIVTTAVSFKESSGRDELTDSDIMHYEPQPEACEFVTRLAANWVKLQQKANTDKKIALILPNYPSTDSRLANGVGLDTPQSTYFLLQKLREAGYDTGDSDSLDSLQDGTDLVHRIAEFVTNETSTSADKTATLSIDEGDFFRWYNQIDEVQRRKIEQQWGHPYEAPNYENGRFLLPGICYGNVYVSMQPSRGYNIDLKASYHSPDLPPTYDYLAYYCWIEEIFGADAVIHVGKHGNLEWLPGKSVALSRQTCFPATAFGPIPHFYPFIVNDPGEGTQAKRRNHAVIIDHLIPPMTRAETYGSLLQLEQLIDEYYQAATMDPKRTEHLKKKIKELVDETGLATDLGQDSGDMDELLMAIDGYLCELKEAQIRGGLHILGQAPEDEKLTDLLVALHRVPSGEISGITRALATDLNLTFDPLNCEYADSFDAEINGVFCRTVGDAVEQLETIAKRRVAEMLRGEQSENNTDTPCTNEVISYIRNYTLPRVDQTEQELSHIIDGLNGTYIPSGSSGAPTRGRLDILPTGRNFYSVDIRAIPTETAFELGKKSADLLIERYMQEHGDYPETIGLSAWGTATMRTGGDDIGQALALMGVQPIWEGVNRRVKDFEVLPLFQLNRPRVDVVLRISGFFRDAFPDIISLFNAAVEKVAMLDEPPDQNPIRKRYLEEKQNWQEAGLDERLSQERALYRVFGSKPGAYGAGLQGLIDQKHWKTREDLAQVYMNWSGYAYYGSQNEGRSAHEVFKTRLGTIDAVMQNQDNREHDILDSDDYYQFHGGLANAVESEKGEQPDIYFGDHARPENPRVKTLKEELLKVYRSRAVNPKWLSSMREHGYKGAFEMAATMDYLFAYDATTDLVDDFVYEGITESYLFDQTNREFIQKQNPWALRDMSERMLEAIQRGMWKNPDEETLQQLKSIYLDADGILEEEN